MVVPTGVAGEIVVKGPVVSTRYYNRADSNALGKIHDPRDGGTWHRMGDLGYLDTEGRLWFVGRKAHRVVTAEHGTLFTITCEAIFNQHPMVYRTALVGVGPAGAQKPVICVELEKGTQAHWPQLQRELQELGARYVHTQAISTFLLHPAFPVDIRHNSKIFREKLAVWAEDQLK
ncbi:putative sulfoacetate--CoA ligase [compost metagenome]